jgi:hypothetical protein
MNLHALNDTPPEEWPDNADETISKVLRDKKAMLSERVLAAELAAETVVMNDDMADLLLDILEDVSEPEELRSIIPISLGPCLEYSDLMELDYYSEDDEIISEEVFDEIRERLRELYFAEDVPKNVRRRILEGSVRSPMDWHFEAIGEAYSSDDEEWRLTAVFCMGYVDGFEDQIIEALESENSDIFYEAICAAGNWGIEAAWPYIEELLTSKDTDKTLLLAAIEAAPYVNPEEAEPLLSDFIDSEDEDIVEAAEDALDAAGMNDEDLYDYDDGDLD